MEGNFLTLEARAVGVRIRVRVEISGRVIITSRMSHPRTLLARFLKLLARIS